MKKIVYLLTLFVILGSCNNSSKQPTRYGEKPLNLKKLNFDINMQGFFPQERTIGTSPLIFIVEPGKEAKNNQEAQADGVYYDEVYIVRQVVRDETPKNGTLYHYHTPASYSSLPGQYKLATFSDYYFDRLNMTTTSDDELIMVSASRREVNSETAKELFYELARSYGEPQRERTIYQGLQECEIFTWEKKDRIIKYYWTLSTLFEKNDLRDLHLSIIKKDQLKTILSLLRLKDNY